MTNPFDTTALPLLQNEYFEEVCRHFREGISMNEPENQEIMRGVFQHITKIDDVEAFKTLLDSGMPLDYNMPEYLIKNFTTFAVSNMAINCIKELQSMNFDFCAPECTMIDKNYFLYSARIDNLEMTQIFAEHFIQKDNAWDSDFQINAVCDEEKKNVMHYVAYTSKEDLFDYVMSLPLDPALFYQKDSQDETPLMLAMSFEYWGHAEKMINRFESSEPSVYNHYLNELFDSISLIPKEYGYTEGKLRLLQMIEIKKEKIALSHTIDATPQSHKTTFKV